MVVHIAVPMQSNSPATALRGHLYRNSSADGAITMNVDNGSGSQASEERSIQGRAFTDELARQISSASISSQDSVHDLKLVQSIHNLQR